MSMISQVYAKLDSANVYLPSGVRVTNVFFGAMGYSASDLSIIHSDIPVAAGVDFSVEAVFNAGTDATCVFGLCSLNTTYTGKELKVFGGASPVKVNGVDIAGTALAFATTTTVHLDFFAATGRVLVYANSVLKADVTIPSLVGKPVYVFGSAPPTNGGMMFSMGQSGFNQPMFSSLNQAGIYARVTNATSMTDSYERKGFESLQGPRFDNLVEAGIAVGCYGTSEPKSYTISETDYAFVRLIQGGGRSGGRAEACKGEIMSTGRSSKDMRMPTAMKPSNVRQGTNAFEQMREAPYKPREFWGDN